MSPADPMLLRRTFDAVAGRYDRVRPTYDAEIFDDLAALAGLERGSRILEIGCGSGQATVALAERGYDVTALDLGAELAAIARRKLGGHPNARVVVGAFEEWALPSERFDAVVSATAFHWVDPAIRVAKSAMALRPGGCVAIIETRRFPLGDEAFLAALWECHAAWEPDAQPPRGPTADERAESQSEIEASGLFGPVVWRRYDAEHRLSREDYLELIMTFSNVLALEPARQSGLLRCIGELLDRQPDGGIGELIFNFLVVARTPDPERAASLAG